MKLKPERGAPFLLGGVDVAIDCVGSRSRARTSRCGSPAPAAASSCAGIPTEGADLTPLWFRELELVGAYTGGYGDRSATAKRRHQRSTLAIDARARRTRSTGSSARPTRSGAGARRIDHALGAGKLGTLKVAFDPRAD